MGKRTITETLVRKNIVELAHYLQLQRTIEQQIDAMQKYDREREDDMEEEELRGRTDAKIELNSEVSIIKQLAAEKEEQLRELFDEVFSVEKLGIKIFRSKDAYENAKWLWENGELLEDLHEDIMNTDSEKLDNASLILQSLASYNPWESDMTQTKDGWFSFLIKYKALHEDFMNANSKSLDNATVVLQIFAGNKFEESDMPQIKNGRLMIKHQMWNTYIQEHIEKYKQDAKNGDADAQYMLGHLYYYGLGVEQDYVEATKQWHSAGEKGHAGAKCYLGKCYAQTSETIKGVIPNQEKAIELWKEAAGQGNVKARYFLEKYS